jgi:AcrR family transcriptional regulator
MIAMNGVAQGKRRYRGLTAAERHQQRRELLLDAGLELFGTLGYAGSSVRAISQQAGLNSRYFYESFNDREALLVAVYERIIAEIAAAVLEATESSRTVENQARSGLDASWAILTGDRRKARVLAIEVVGVSERLEALRRAYRHAFADLLVRNTMMVVGEGVQTKFDPVLIARALMGGVIDVLVDWINDELDHDRSAIVEHFTALFTAAAAVALDETPAKLMRRVRSVPPGSNGLGAARVEIEQARRLAGADRGAARREGLGDRKRRASANGARAREPRARKRQPGRGPGD